MATATQSHTLHGAWQRIAEAKQRDGVLRLDAWGQAEIVVTERGAPEVSGGRVVVGAHEVIIRGAEEVWGRGSGTVVSTVLPVVPDYAPVVGSAISNAVRQVVSGVAAQAAQQAAEGAAAAVAPAAADAIRAQVAADADRAEAAAAGLASAFVVVEQVDNTLPTRPAGAGFVIWLCWSDPTSRMIPGDIWIKPEAPPALPGIPTSAEIAAIRFQGGPDGATSAVFGSGIAKQYPVLQAIDYQIDGGAWQRLRAAPFVAGDTVPLAALPVGDHDLRLRFVNFLGAGDPSAIRKVRAHGAEFTDDFAVALGALPNFAVRDNWTGSTSIITAGGFAVPDPSVRNAFVAAGVQFPGLSTVRGANLFIEADIQRLVGSTATPLIGFSNSNGTQSQGIYVGMLTADRMALIHRDQNGVLNMRADVALPAGHTNKGRARIQITGDGATATAFLDGVSFGTYANPLYASPTGPSAPAIAFRVPSGTPAGAARIGMVKAGKIVP